MRKIIYNRIANRKKRISSKIVGSVERPRISVYRSNRFVYAQAIDDASSKTIIALSSYHVKKDNKDNKNKKSEEAKLTGIMLAKKLIEKKILSGVFDRGRYAYNGRVKSLAEGLREGGLKI